MILITRMIAVACSMQMSQLLFVSHDLVALVLLLLLLCLPLFFKLYLALLLLLLR